MKRKKILVLAPHPDDEVLGLGGYLYSESQKGSKIRILYGCTDGQQRRIDELMDVGLSLGNSSFAILFAGMDSRLHTVDTADVIGKIDEEIDEFKPDEIFVNYPSHHQDHKTMHECAMAALRLKQFYMPPFVALYEYPFVFNHREAIPGGKCYFELCPDTLDRKVYLFSLYASQNKKAPSPLNENGIVTLAKVRGLESGVPYAECFYIQKMML